MTARFFTPEFVRWAFLVPALFCLSCAGSLLIGRIAAMGRMCDPDFKEMEDEL